MRELKTAYDLACQRVIRNKTQYETQATSFEFVTDFNPNIKVEKKEDINLQDSEKINYSGKPLEVTWSGNMLDYGGFARLNRSFVFGLSNRNVKVRTEIQEYYNNVNDSTRKVLEELSNTPVNPKSPKVFGASMPMDMSHTGKKIIFTMIETSQGIHKDYREKLNLFDEIWVPTEIGKKLLKDSGVRAPIYVIPLGVDIDRYNVDAKPLTLKTKLNKFKFISVFKWSYRKGPDLLLKAYLEEFSSKDDVSLLLVTRTLNVPEDVGLKTIMQEFENIRQTVKKDDLPHVALYPELVSERKMPSLYKACNAFVLMSRGEGFGLPNLEASSCGLPVITTNCTAQMEYLDKDNSFLVDPQEYAVSSLSSSGGFSKMAKMAHFYEGQYFPVFGEESIFQARRHMRYVFENEQEAKEKNNNLIEKIKKDYVWDLAIDKVYNRLQESQ